jgi:hypothetical protein
LVTFSASPYRESWRWNLSVAAAAALSASADDDISSSLIHSGDLARVQFELRAKGIDRKGFWGFMMDLYRQTYLRPQIPVPCHKFISSYGN